MLRLRQTPLLLCQPGPGTAILCRIMNRILVEKNEVRPDGTCVLSGARAAHINGVLHAAPGRSVRIGVIDGPRGAGTVTVAGPDEVTLACEFEDAIPPVPRVTLLLAMPRPKVMKRLWAPLASLGVGRILIANAEKVERNYFDTHWLDPASYRPLLVEGLQQAGLTRLPAVSVHMRLRPFIEDGTGGWPVKLAADPSAPDRLAAVSIPPAAAVLIAVGPEGGWTPFETGLFAANGFRGISLSASTLRSDVACIALLSVLNERLP